MTCPVCGFRYPLKKFKPDMKQIVYPVQIVTGGGRAKGFKVVEYLLWSILPSLKETDIWNSLLYLYNRLGAAYDQFYEVLGFLSPKMRVLLQRLQRKYTDSYQANPLREYARVYSSTQLLPDIVEPYCECDYPEAYSHLSLTQSPEGVHDE